MVRQRTDLRSELLDNQSMDIPKMRVTAIDRFSGDAVISFEDNRTAVFPASFLYASLPHVQELFESELELDDVPKTAQ